jgi:hypothetical protein
MAIKINNVTVIDNNRGFIPETISAGSTTGTSGQVLKSTGIGLTWSSSGATGGGEDQVLFENDQIVTTNYTITAGRNAISAGPITIDSGATITVPSESNWVIV